VLFHRQQIAAVHQLLVIEVLHVVHVLLQGGNLLIRRHYRLSRPQHADIGIGDVEHELLQGLLLLPGCGFHPGLGGIHEIAELAARVQGHGGAQAQLIEVLAAELEALQVIGQWHADRHGQGNIGGTDVGLTEGDLVRNVRLDLQLVIEHHIKAWKFTLGRRALLAMPN